MLTSDSNTPKTAANSFGSYNADDDNLFQVRQGVPAVDALESASCSLCAVIQLTYDLSELHNVPAFTAVAHLAESAKAIVDAATKGLMESEDSANLA